MALTTKEKNEKYPVSRYRLNPRTAENLADAKVNSDCESWNEFFMELLAIYKKFGRPSK